MLQGLALNPCSVLPICSWGCHRWRCLGLKDKLHPHSVYTWRKYFCWILDGYYLFFTLEWFSGSFYRTSSFWVPEWARVTLIQVPHFGPLPISLAVSQVVGVRPGVACSRLYNIPSLEACFLHLNNKSISRGCLCCLSEIFAFFELAF